MQKSRSDREVPEHAVDLLLDSGAFSAWKKGKRIDLRAYIKFVQANLPLLYAYVNLDVIPGRLGRPAVLGEIEEAAAESYRNYKTMRKAGLAPIPVFHLGEREDWLRRILDSGAEWIGLGGSVGKPDEARYRFFSRSFELISAMKSPPRVHGFGSTSIITMIKFPWYSVDSTSWVMASAMGSILVPAAGGEGFDFSKLTVVRVSGRGSDARQAAGFGDIYRAHLSRFLASEGSGLAQVRSDQGARNYINIRSMMQTTQAAGVRLFFSTWMREGDNQANKLTQAGARNRLLSYWEVGQDEGALREYIIRGALPQVRRDESPGKSFKRMAYRGMRATALVARSDSVEVDV